MEHKFDIKALIRQSVLEKISKNTEQVGLLIQLIELSPDKTVKENAEYRLEYVRQESHFLSEWLNNEYKKIVIPKNK